MNRRRTASRNAVLAGSLCDSKMKFGEDKGNIKSSIGGESFREDGRGRGGGGFGVYRRLKRNKSDSAVENRTRSRAEAEKNPIQLRKSRSDSQRILDENSKSDVCDEKNLERSLSNVGQITLAKENGNRELEEEEEFEDQEEVEMEKESFDIKEMNAPDEKLRENGEEEKLLHQIHETPKSANVEKNPIPTTEIPAIDPDFTKPTSTPVAEAFESIEETQNRMQNLVDLVMWRDISKSALIFGLGTFILVSSSYTKDINFSLISAISYMGLVHLAVIFFYKSIICRGTVDFIESDQKYMVLGEEEVIWILKMILPYFNEVLCKIRGLFSGDPATTMKLAIFLFVLARCGGSITIWTMARLAFFAVFTVPKFCSAYSHQLTAYGNFWARRFQDAWNSCAHKKAVAAAIFTLIWNLSSVIARIWAAFFLIVAVRFYQQSLVRDEWSEGEVHGDWNGGPTLVEKSGPTPVEMEKEKKGS